jgi:hypothetical protein
MFDNKRPAIAQMNREGPEGPGVVNVIELLYGHE